MVKFKVPENCSLRVGDLNLKWKEGEAFIFDDSYEHAVWKIQRKKGLFSSWTFFIRIWWKINEKLDTSCREFKCIENLFLFCFVLFHTEVPDMRKVVKCPRPRIQEFKCTHIFWRYNMRVQRIGYIYITSNDLISTHIGINYNVNTLMLMISSEFYTQNKNL